MLVQGNRLSLFFKAQLAFTSTACFSKQTMAVEKKYILLQNMRHGTAEII